MLHDLFCGDPLLQADLEGLGLIGAVTLEVDLLGVSPDIFKNVTDRNTHRLHSALYI